MTIVKIITGTNGNDTLIGADGSEIIIGGKGNDVLTGGAGDDLLDGGAGNDQLFGGAGNDILYGGAGTDTGDGGSGSDIFLGGDGNDKGVYNFGENKATPDAYDYYHGGSGTDILQLTFTNAELTSLGLGSADQAILAIKNHFNAAHGGTVDFTSLGFHLVVSSFENIQIVVTNPPNVFEGTTGNDQLTGTTNDETFLPGAGNDVINAGGGTDTLSYATDTAGIAINLATGTATGAQIGSDTFSGVEVIKLGSGSNVVTAPSTTAQNMTIDISAGGTTQMSLFAGAQTTVSLASSNTQAGAVDLVFNSIPNATATLDFANGEYSFNPIVIDRTPLRDSVKSITLTDSTALATFKSLANRDVTVKADNVSFATLNTGITADVQSAAQISVADSSTATSSTTLAGTRNLHMTDQADTLNIANDAVGTTTLAADMGDAGTGANILDASKVVKDLNVKITSGSLVELSNDTSTGTISVAHATDVALGDGSDAITIAQIADANGLTIDGGAGTNSLTIALESSENTASVQNSEIATANGTLTVANIDSLDYDVANVSGATLTVSVADDSISNISVNNETHTMTKTLSLADATFKTKLSLLDADTQRLENVDTGKVINVSGFNKYVLTDRDDSINATLSVANNTQIDGGAGNNSLTIALESSENTASVQNSEIATGNGTLTVANINSLDYDVTNVSGGELRVNVRDDSIRNIGVKNETHTMTKTISLTDATFKTKLNLLDADTQRLENVNTGAVINVSGFNKYVLTNGDDVVTAKIAAANGVEIDGGAGLNKMSLSLEGSENTSTISTANIASTNGSIAYQNIDSLAYDVSNLAENNVTINVASTDSISKISVENEVQPLMSTLGFQNSYFDNVKLSLSAQQQSYTANSATTQLSGFDNYILTAGDDSVVYSSGDFTVNAGDGIDLVELIVKNQSGLSQMDFLSQLYGLAHYFELHNINGYIDFGAMGFAGMDLQAYNVENLKLVGQYNGVAFKNIFVGSYGPDFFQGDNVDNIFFGSSGWDNLRGGTGFDSVEYQSPVFTSLAGQLYTNTVGKYEVDSSSFDRLLNIEHIVASKGDDTFFVNNSNLNGYSIDGSSGVDTLNFFASSAGVNFSTLAGSISNIEQITGSNYDDTFTTNLVKGANLGVNYLDGSEGVDTLAIQTNLIGTTLIENLAKVPFTTNFLLRVGSEFVAHPGGFIDLAAINSSYQFVFNGFENLQVSASFNGEPLAQLFATGLANNETVQGSGLIDVFMASGGFDSYIGGNGDDIVAYTSPYISSISAQLDTDNVTKNFMGTAQFDHLDSISRIVGSSGSDTFFATDSLLNGYTLDGGSDHDILSFAGAGSGINFQFDVTKVVSIEEGVGSQFNDTLTLTSANTSVLHGGDGNDVLTGNDGDDQVFGDNGNDTLFTNFNSGLDFYDGGAGKDLLEIVANQTGGTTLIDQLIFAAQAGAIANHFANHLGEFIDFSQLTFAGPYDQQIQNFEGLHIAASYNGIDVTDFFVGSNGADSILGTSGADIIRGLQGNDLLVSNGGADQFIFGANNGHDRVLGFTNDDILSFKGNANVQDSGDLQITHPVGGGTLISIDANNSITLEGFSGTLTPDHFIFGA